MKTLAEEIKAWDEERLEQMRKDAEAFDALPQAEKDRRKKRHEDKVAADIQPHRLDLTDDDNEETE